MRDILILGVAIAVVIILVRTILNTPFVQQIRENFANGGGNMINTLAECPPGTQMFMYDGSAYCCSGKINGEADTLKGTCKPSWQRDAPPLTFCTLGPSREGVPNCLESRAGILQAIGQKSCPASMPNFVMGAPGSVTGSGRCCAGPGNSALTECQDTASGFCSMSTDSNEFKNATSCQFLKLKESAGSCPPNFTPLTTQGAGALTGLTLFGCTDMGKNCYSQAVLQRLQELKYDITGLTPCTATGTN
jgi:hypothetical protein